MRKLLCAIALALPLCGALVTLPTVAAYAKDGSGGSGSSSSKEVRIIASLSGPAISGVRPGGNADARVQGARRSFKVEAEHVNLPDGTVLTVKLNGALVGTLRLALGRGQLELNTQDHATPPVAVVNDAVTVVTADGVVALSGKFSAK